MKHPRSRWDDAFQTPIRFSLMAALVPDVEIDFRTLRELLEADDSALSKAVSHLDAAGYVAVTKGHVGNRPRTWMRPTRRGVDAFRAHIAALRDIAGDYPETPAPQ